MVNSLKRANADLEDFAYMVSHDLKAPLRGISALVSWLIEDYTDKFDNNGKENISLIQERVEKMEDLINGILEYSALGVVELKREVVDTEEIVQSIIKSMDVPKQTEVKVLNKLPSIQADKIRIRQLFQNLISNAIKYADEKNGKIEISSIDKGKHYHFKVSDNGKGIAPEYHLKIFKMFQKLDANKNSTGIGLSIVKKIIDIYSGTIWVESEENKGTTFNFTFRKHPQ